MAENQRRSVESVLARTPFSRSELPPDKVEILERTFIEMSQLAIETSDEAEERWAYRKEKEAYCEAMGNPPIDPETGLPAGFWQAMEWAADLSVAHERRFIPPTATSRAAMDAALEASRRAATKNAINRILGGDERASP